MLTLMNGSEASVLWSPGDTWRDKIRQSEKHPGERASTSGTTVAFY